MQKRFGEIFTILSICRRTLTNKEMTEKENERMNMNKELAHKSGKVFSNPEFGQVNIIL
jgi:hypothetical protein